MTNYITFSYYNIEHSIKFYSESCYPLSSIKHCLSVKLQQILKWSLLLGVSDDFPMKQYVLYVMSLFQNHMDSSCLLSNFKIFFKYCTFLFYKGNIT